MDNSTKISIAIILGAVIIGGFIYFSPRKETSVVSENYQPVIHSTSNTPTKTTGCLANSNAIVTKVIDGDTVVVEGGYHIRLLGMDADEKNYPCYEAAKTRLEVLVLNNPPIFPARKREGYGVSQIFFSLGIMGLPWNTENNLIVCTTASIT